MVMNVHNLINVRQILKTLKLLVNSYLLEYLMFNWDIVRILQMKLCVFFSHKILRNVFIWFTHTIIALTTVHSHISTIVPTSITTQCCLNVSTIRLRTTSSFCCAELFLQTFQYAVNPQMSTFYSH